MSGAPIIDRFWAKVMPEPNSGCWLWTAQISTNGYALLCVAGRRVRAHRFSYELHKGPIPAGLQIDHTCSVRCCVNPDHLDAVTQRENNRRTFARGRAHNVGAFQRQKTHCPAGHPYSGENLALNKHGERYCRICRNASANRAYHRQCAQPNAILRTRTTCPRGHEYSGSNLYVSPSGTFVCRTCSRAHHRRYYKPHPLPPKTHCPHGHPYSGDNLYINRRGRKECRTCRRGRA